MIRIRNRHLHKAIRAELQSYQRILDGIADYGERVERAKAAFKYRNNRENHVFQVIKCTLSKMCSGSRRCMYCEDSGADEVEHIKPKDFYPEATFLWENYLYACGICNGGKSNKFAIINPQTGEHIDIIRKRNDPVEPPAQGNPALIDPRFENPFDYLALDLRDTFELHPLPAISAAAELRAKYTRDTLELNRDMLKKARGNAYGSYRARLREYIQERDTGTELFQLSQLVKSLKNLEHPTVWREMQRQYRAIPELKGLFEQAPEALNW
jgi:uncharacterized protein (TIGR02646 family)